MVSNAGVGSNSWTSPGNSVSSNNSYATVGAKGITQYLLTSNFGFSIPSPSGIAGIQLDVERSTNGPVAVALLDAWNIGLTRSISAGTNRCLIVAYAQENGVDTRDITAMTYGGRSMTQVAERTAGTTGGFMARLEVWMLLEADIALAGSTTIVPTYGSYTDQEYCEVFSSAVFQNVDQLAAVSSLQSTGAVSPPSTANPHQLGSAITTTIGSMAINVVTEGNNTSPGVTNGATGTYTINSGYTEGTDIYFANTSVAATSGACFQTAHKPITANGTEQPTCTFNGTVNRWAMIAFNLQRARELDHRVQLMLAGTVGGNDLSSTTAWPTTDAYASYGGPSNLWGRSWSTTDINASNFGAAVSARVQNGTARVDHMRLSVYYFSTLPVELLHFRAVSEGKVVRLDWATASEQDNDHFVVQRSSDGVAFEDVLRRPGAGDSQVALFYSATDDRPFPGTSYYRLVQVDTDGSMDFSAVVPVVVEGEAFMVFPNPTLDGVLTIHDPEGRKFEVGVYDEAMRLVSRSAVPSNDPLQLLAGLPEGTYTLLVSNGGRMQARQVMKVSRSQ